MSFQVVPCAGPEIRRNARLVRVRIYDAVAEEAKPVTAFEKMVYGRALGDRLPRRDALEAALAKIDAVGKFGRITMHSQLSKREYRFALCRAVPTTLTNEDWHEDAEELGICVLTQMLMVEKRKYFTTSMDVSRRNIVVISQHTLERFFQRAWTATDEALMDDLTLVTAAVLRRKVAEGNKLVIADFPPEDIIIPTNNGTWRGSLEPVLDSLDRPDLVLNVRTFV